MTTEDVMTADERLDEQAMCTRQPKVIYGTCRDKRAHDVGPCARTR
ncbi:MAG: hypothetical protein ACE5OS_02625 [Anaerolineae bacterium]